MRRLDRIERAVLALAALAVVARFIGLGTRPFHWDEARVGYWTLRSLDTGVYEYRPVAGGPFLYVVGRWLFGLGLTSDAAARVPVALIGGLLPLAALLFRRATLVDDDGTEESGETLVDTARLPRVGLSDAETVALALLLAVAPPLLYYSRVLRGDLPLAAFSLVAVGFALRARVRGDRRSVYAAAGAFGLALTTSGFVLATVLCWLLAAVLTVDEARLRGTDLATVRARASGLASWLVGRQVALLRGIVVALATAMFFYVPRGWTDLGRPSTVLTALDAGTVGAVERFLSVRVLGRHSPPTYTNDHPLLPFVVGNAEVLVAAALPVVGLAVYGFFRERYAGTRRPVVAFTTYWAGAGLLLYPVATEVNEPWVALHPLVPAAVPAAVGIVALWRHASAAVDAADAARLAAALLLLSAAGVHTGAVVAGEVYDEPAPEDSLPGYAQPGSEMHAVVENMSVAITANGGTDVLYVGEGLAVGDEATLAQPPVPEAEQDAFARRLPFAWYVERADAETSSVAAPDAVPDSAPPVVVTTPEYRGTLTRQLTGYERYQVDTGLTDRTLVVFVNV
ncbi:flippase activity-associated protein Agl23 [Halolamina litorea]|nr:flippase activity-associated protein Agl23 [Halolamina litorea]